MTTENKGMRVAELSMPRISLPQPVCALLVFAEQGEPVVTRHALTVDERGPTIGVGAPLAVDDAAMLGAMLNGREVDAHTLLPGDLLGISRWRMTWVTPATVRPMWFRFRGGEAKRLFVPWPRLILSSTKDALHVAAVKTRARPAADTVLYHAPLMNVNRDGSLCLGNARLPQEVGLPSRAGAEAVLYDTAFSHVNHDRTLRLEAREAVSSGQHLSVWRRLANDDARRFPTQCLQPMGQRLSEFLGRLRA